MKARKCLVGLALLFSGYISLKIASYLLISLTEGIVGIVTSLIQTGISLAIAPFMSKFLLSTLNKLAADHKNTVSGVNADNRDYNQRVKTCLASWQNEFPHAQQDLNQSLAGNWFPPDYLNLKSLAFFINAMQNNKADNLRDLVNLCDTHEFHQANLQQMRNLQALQQTTNSRLSQNNSLLQRQNALQEETNKLLAQPTFVEIHHYHQQK